ncbi:hypothetical protein B0J18DRAFT_45185 [Chaetomium sp. MPI-SDFR-AT-0129]|nr:hypothetical protein B0J18DRAFT_45185 [Chaetomium sp. MPI-SDFR-AT-0129]
MEALLGLATNQSNNTCGSLADLKSQLRDLLHGRVTDTHAEHTSNTFQIRATAVFEIPGTANTNNGTTDGGTPNIDPSLGGGTQSNATPGAGVDGNGAGPQQPAQRVNAMDALINQPADDPVLQTAIARLIISALSEVDSSSWVVRQVSRNDQCWAFTYLCKDSWQTWSRQTSKTPAKLAIGEWSEKGGQDPIHMSRPAFDCHGSVKISFVKSTKTIDVKYEHTPIHKTVAELIELLAPAPPPPIALPLSDTPAEKKAKEPKEPRAPREPKPKTPRPPRKRKGENGEASQPSKRRQSKGAAAILPPEMPGALPVGESSTRELYNTQSGDGIPPPGGSSSYPEGLVGANDTAGASAPSDVHAHSILNLPPGEAARRWEVAMKLLNDSNLDPRTLSTEQFSIFANQSPELQQDSLAMLIKYGAERLRIVHPSGNEADSSSEPTPDPPPVPELAIVTPQPEVPKKKSRSKTAEGAEGGGRPGICNNCRRRRFTGKCDKVKPSCSLCIELGVECIYSAPPPRKKKTAEPTPDAPEQNGAQVPEEQSEVLGDPGFTVEPAPQPPSNPPSEQPNHPNHESGSMQDHYDNSVYPALNVSASESMPHQAETPSAVFNTSHSIYHHPSGLSFPDIPETGTGDLAQPGVLSNAGSEPTSVGYIPSSMAENSDTSLHAFAYPQPASAQNSTSGYGDSTERLDGPASSRNTGEQASTTRTSLPGGQPPRAPEPSMNATDPQSSWSSLANTTSQQPAKSSPRQARAKKAAPVSQGYDDTRRQPTPTNKGSASQATSRTARTSRDSPFQPPAQPARATSRQSNRAVTATPQPTTSDQAHGYNQYQTTGNTEAESSMDRISYQPYSHRGSNQQGSYSSAENSYNVRAPTTAAPTYPETVSQNVASSYPMNPSTTTSTAQWSTSTSSPQTRNAHVYNATQSAAGNTSYNTASNTS